MVLCFLKNGKVWSKPSLYFLGLACVLFWSSSQHKKQTSGVNNLLELKEEGILTSRKEKFLFWSPTSVIFVTLKMLVLRQKSVRILVRKVLLVLFLLFYEATLNFERLCYTIYTNISKLYLKSSTPIEQVEYHFYIFRVVFNTLAN